MKEITFDQFPLKERIASYNVLGTFSPAVFKREKGYCIRIIEGQVIRGNNTTMQWNYFDLDEAGMIIKSPRGMAREFNKKVRITDIDQAVESHKDVVINQ